MSTVHKPVLGSLGPLRTTSSSWFEMVTLVLVKVALQSLSHSCPIDNRLPVFRSSNTRALFAIAGMLGIASCVLLVDIMAWPLGHPTDSGDAWVVVMAELFMMYVPVAPESGCALIDAGCWATRFVRGSI